MEPTFARIAASRSPWPRLVERWWRRDPERELDEEVRFHLDMEAERLEAQGLAPAEARRRARLAFGGVERIKEECRDERRGHALELFLHDARLAVRSLLRNPGYTAAVVLTLALGIGANSAVFSLVNGVLLRPLPYRHGEGLVLLHQSQPKTGSRDLPFSIREAEEIRRLNRSFSRLAEYHSMSFTLLGRGEPERVRTGVVSTDFFDLLGVVPLYGRTFRAEDDLPGAEAVLVLSHGYWQRSFGGEPEIVGQIFEMNNRPHRVVGVLPPVPPFPQDNDVYMPTSACPFRAAAEQRRTERAFSSLTLVGRLRSEVSPAAVREDLASLAERFRRDHPEVYPEDRGFRITAVPLKEELVRRARPLLLMLLGTAGLVLLIACANGASLTVARQLRRERETAVRTALGAGRGRLARQELTENLLLSLAGGALGLGLAYGGLDLLVAFTARFTPRAVDVEIDGWVLAFTLAVSMLSGALASSLTRLSGSANPARALGESRGATASRRKLRLRGALVAAQVAVSVMLLAGAGLMLRSLDKLQRVDLGFETERVLAARIPLNWSKYGDGETALAFFASLLDRVRAHPEVLAAALTSDLPVGRQAAHTMDFLIEDHPSLRGGGVAPRLDFKVASPGFFRTLGIPLIQGRTFTSRDDAAAAPVAVINRSLARHHWGDRDPVGARVSMDGGESWRTVVGVVGDIQDFGPAAPAADQLYVPLAQSGWSQYLLLRATADPSTLVPEIRQIVRALDPDQPVTEIQTLTQMRRASTASPRLTSWLLGLFAAVALLITATGLAGMISFTVSQRRHEIGIRMALGARRSTVVLWILRQGLALVAAGLGLGLLGALLWSRAFDEFLFGIRPTDPLTLTLVALVLLGVTGTACLVPARRATSVDPTLALRSD